jgi:hypothetical protein
MKHGMSLPSWAGYNSHVQKFILIAGSRGYKTWTTVAIYHRRLSSFVAVASDYFEMPISCATSGGDFCGVCSNLSPVSYNFTLRSARCFVVGFLARSDPVDLTLLITFQMYILCFELCSQNTYDEIFSSTTHHIRFVQKITLLNSVSNHIDLHKNNQYLTRC